MELQLPGTKSKWKSEIISWNAVLIGTAAFAAPFALLQGNSNPLHAEWKNYETQSEYNLFLLLFYVFFLADTVALVTSVAATVLLLFAIIGEKEDKPMVEISFMAVMKALLAVLLAYGCAVALLLGPKYLWLTVTVCVPLSSRVCLTEPVKRLFTLGDPMARHHYIVPSSTDAQVKMLLEKHGATRNAKVVREVQLRNIATSKSKWKTETISLNAATFVAPFSLLGNANPLKGKRVHVTEQI
ncbi:hypothetical protein SUGI_0424530 [Cryptomeria japonica]|nr:hypothetical protein SUGI_0424530 [Cryptomeria japonica]